MAILFNRMPESEKPMSQVSNSKTSATLTTALDSGKKTIINTRRPKESECYLYYSASDFVINRYFLKDIKDIEHKNYLESQLKVIENYIYTDGCRRKILLKAFGQEISDCNKCDNCMNRNNKENKKDYTLEFSITDRKSTR